MLTETTVTGIIDGGAIVWVGVGVCAVGIGDGLEVGVDIIF